MSYYEFVLEALADSKIMLSFSLHNGVSKYWTCLWIGDSVLSVLLRSKGINPRVEGNGGSMLEGLSKAFDKLRLDMRTSLYIIGVLEDYRATKKDGITCTYPSYCPSRNTDIPLTSIMCRSCHWALR